MKGLFSFITLLVLPAALAFNAHDAGVSRRHHHLERKLEEVVIPAKSDITLASNSTHELSRRAFTNAKASWYKVGMGACGRVNGPSDFIVALNAAQFGNGYPGPHCFEKIRITYKGISAIAEIRDRCPGCPYGGLDFSEGLFSHFTGLGTGIIYMQWEFVNGSGGDSGGNDDKPTSTTKTTKQPTSTHTTTTSRRTTTTTHRSTPTSTRTSSSSSRTTARPTTTDDEETTTSSQTTSSSATPTPTPDIEEPDNVNNMLQAMLQMTELLSAASRDVRGERK